MVVLPYKCRVELISNYIQELIMESLWNNGSTYNSYLQQLRYGLDNSFAVFIPAANPDHQVTKTPGKSPFEVMYQSI